MSVGSLQSDVKFVFSKRKFSLFLFLLFVSIPGFAQTQEKKILFKGDSLWYAAKDHLLFSSANQGLNWDTIFAKKNPPDTVFFNGVLDTATNVFISDQRTLFVFAWDGTMHYKTVLYATSDCGKTWSKFTFNSFHGVVGVKYFHKSSSNSFFIYLRDGTYAITGDYGKTWSHRHLGGCSVGCFDDRFSIDQNGDLRIGYSNDRECKTRHFMCSKDGGMTWKKSIAK